MNADGSDQHDVSNDHAAADLNPTWSPNGRRLAFTSDRDGANDIFVMGTDGSHPVNLTPDPASDRNATWSPDGTEIAFASDRSGRFHLYALRRDGSRVTRLTNDAGSDTIPDWQLPRARYDAAGVSPSAVSSPTSSTSCASCSSWR
jgi:Tol biopolymer transport system component